MKNATLKIYYHEERGFLYSENWPIHIFSDSPHEEHSKMFQSALRKTIEESVPFEDQKVGALVSMHNGDGNLLWAPKHGQFYEIPFQKVEVIEVDTVEDGGGCFVAGSKTVAHLIPYTPEPSHEEIQADQNALLLGNLLDLSDRVYHYLKANVPDKQFMTYNEYEDILENLAYYKTEYFDTRKYPLPSTPDPVKEENPEQHTAEQWLEWLDKRCMLDGIQRDYVFVALKSLEKKS